jgi:predicted ABC-type exoprotein transport system permease subunit
MKYLWLLAPCVVALWTPLYNRIEPAIFGFPFFFWFQLLLVPLSALCIWAADRQRRG